MGSKDDRLREIKARYRFVGETSDFIPHRDMQWLVSEVERLREAAHIDQITIQRLRREVNEWSSIYVNAEAKLAQALQRAGSRGGRVPR